jgi:hypothetical protein
MSNKFTNSLKSITPSGYFGNSINNINELPNFLSTEEIEALTHFARNNTTWDITESEYNENGTIIYDHTVWENRVATQDSLIKADPEILRIINSMIERLKVEVENFFNVEVVPTGPAVVRWPVGARQEPHADKELHEGPDAGSPNAFPWYDIASLFYFNDNYEGGELYFPLQGIEFKPTPGSAYFFPGDMNYIHGVRPVLSGTRYTCPFFWTVTKLGKDNE